jgi:L-iditol 2-dehydrogenase
MKAVAAISPGHVEVVDIPKPEFGDYECLVRTTACGFCNSTDMKIIDGHLHNFTVEFPLIFGHENVGQVVETGPKVKYIEEGDTYVNPSGRLMPGTRFHSMWTAMAEYAVVQDHKAMKEDGVDERLMSSKNARLIPKEFSPADGAVLLTIKENYSALNNFGMRKGMDVLVYGDGPVGFGLIKLLKVMGARYCACVGHRDDRLKRVSRLAGADTCVNSHNSNPVEVFEDRKFDIVIDGVGKSDVILEGAQMLKPGGRLGAYGVLDRSDATVNLLDLPNNILLHLLNFPFGEHDAHEEVLAMVAKGLVDPGDYYTHILDVSKAPEGVRMIREREAMKVIITF